MAAISLLILILLISATAAEAYKEIGVCYGTLGDNLPPAAEVVGLYERYGIGRMRLFEPDAAALRAASGTAIRVSVGIKNEDIEGLAAGRDRVEEWFAYKIGPYVLDVAYEYVVVGNEVIPGELGRYVLPVMQMMRSVLDEKRLEGIKVTTVVPMTALSASYPPSSGQFSDAAIADLRGVLGFLGGQGVALMINVYPYFAYASDPSDVRLDYALFTATGTVVQDGSYGYTNLFDAMVDAFVAAMEKVGAGNVALVVSETGWPSAGGGGSTSPALAGTYNRNLVQRILAGVGTPRRPRSRLEAFVFAMFNEDRKPSAVERSFGLFYPNMEPVYSVF